MFENILLAGLSKSRIFSYAASAPFFKGRKRIDFKPGLNILFGPNGCGKSTILQVLARTMCAEQGGVSTVTQDVLTQNVDFGDIFSDKRKMSSKIGLRVAHDGQPVLFCDPRERKGMTRGGRVDYDFPSHIANEISNRRSHGELAWDRTMLALGPLTGHSTFPTAIDRKITSDRVNETYKSAISIIDEVMTATIEKGQGSILLDEPESSFSLFWHSHLWDILGSKETASNFQIIVASHSPFALNVPGANYIDLVEGYREDIEKMLRRKFQKTSLALR